MIQFNSTRTPALDMTDDLPVQSRRAAQEAARRSLVTGLTAVLLAEESARSVDGSFGTDRLRILAMVALPDVAVTLDEIAIDPERAFDLRPEMARVLLARAAAAQASLLARLSLDGAAVKTENSSSDRILPVDEVAEMMHKPRAWIVRNRAKLPFIRRISRKTFVASEGAVRRWIASQRG